MSTRRSDRSAQDDSAPARRRLLLVRHGAVDYFDADGRPHPPDTVPLTTQGVAQARALGAALARADVRIDRAISSGLPRTQMTMQHLLAAGALLSGNAPTEHWPELQEIRGARLEDIAEPDLKKTFTAAFAGPVPLATRFLNGETIGELLARVLPAVQRLLADRSWDTALIVAHGGVNRALLSWFLAGEPVFFGGLAQDPGALNIIDIATPDESDGQVDEGRQIAAASVVRVVNYCALEPLQTQSRLSTMEHLLGQYRRWRSQRSS
jgi:broad specificity phosphatase PhoE